MSGRSGAGGPRIGLGSAGYRYALCPVARALLLLFALLFLPPHSFAATDTGPRIRVLLRYDDFTKTSDFAVEKKLFRELDRMGIPVLVGAVPFPGAPYPEISTTPSGKMVDLGPEKVALLRDLAPQGHIEVALHGYSHRNNAVGEKFSSEFATLSFDRQRQLLMLGKSAFEATLGVPVRTFVPPFNTYDETTVRALERTGFTVLSADARQPQADAAIAFIPETVSPERMKEAIRNALREKSGTSMLVVVMHNYDFVEDMEPIPESRKNKAKIDSASLLEEIRWAKQQPGLMFVSVEDLLRSREDLSGARVSSNSTMRSNWARSHALLPTGLASPPQDGVFFTTSRANAIKRKEDLLAFGIYTSLLFVMYALSRYLHRITPLGSYRTGQEKLLLALCVILALVGYFHGFYLMAAMQLVSVVGWYLGLVAEFGLPLKRTLWALCNRGNSRAMPSSDSTNKRAPVTR
jgi:hypothetical protein